MLLLPKFLKLKKQRPDSEHQQAAIRVLFWVVFSTYFSFDDHWVPRDGAGVTLLALTVGYGVFSIILLVACLRDDKASSNRRIAGMVGDYLIITLLMGLNTTQHSALLGGMYLWVTLGNGFRYGVRYLYFATFFAGASLIGVLALNPFWIDNFPIWGGLFFGIVAISIYVSGLLRRLQTAFDAERRANEAKSQFLATVSHELRTPLSGIIGMIDVLEDDDSTNEKQKDGFNVIRNSAGVLLGLIDNVLDITRIESGKASIHETEFDLHQLVANMVAILEPSASKKGLAISSNVSSKIPSRLYGDETHLKQVLLNLIGNAIKFTERGRVAVSVGVEEHTAGHVLRFEIRDTGIGIKDSAKSTLFNQFTQADQGVSRRYGGCGLGISISKHLVELVGGEIGFESREGKGSTFWFEIPMQQPPQGAKLVEESKAECATKRTMDPIPFATRASHVPVALLTGVEVGSDERQSKVVHLAKYRESKEINRPLRLLLVDDNRVNLKVMQSIFEKNGYSVMVADGGFPAIEMLDEHEDEIDAAIIDLHMPDLSGDQVVLRWRMLEKKQMPICILTADAREESQKTSLSAGADIFMAKPMSVPKMTEWLHSVAAAKGLTAPRLEVGPGIAMRGDVPRVGAD